MTYYDVYARLADRTVARWVVSDVSGPVEARSLVYSQLAILPRVVLASVRTLPWTPPVDAQEAA